MTEPTKINRWLVVATVVLFIIAGSQAYLLSQKSSDSVLNSQPNLLKETNIFSSTPTIKNWDPLSEIQNIQKNMDRFFGQNFNAQTPNIPSFDLSKMSSHQMSIKDEGNNFLITLEVKGLKETDLNISVKDQTLNISGTIEKTIENKNHNSFSRQFSSRHFQQSATLPGPVKPETVTASYEGDLLKIQIEKS